MLQSVKPYPGLKSMYTGKDMYGLFNNTVNNSRRPQSYTYRTIKAGLDNACILWIQVSQRQQDVE
jgi:hypothetical protein